MSESWLQLLQNISIVIGYTNGICGHECDQARTCLWVQFYEFSGSMDIWQNRMWQYGTTSQQVWTLSKISLEAKCQHQAYKGHSRKVYIWSERYNAYQMPGLDYPSLHFSLPLGSSGNFKSHLLFLTHHCLPLCLLPTECDSSAYSGGFFALTNFLGQRFAERRTDVYVLTFTAPVDGRTGRMGETLCLAPTIFSFSQLCHQDVNLFFGQ